MDEIGEDADRPHPRRDLHPVHLLEAVGPGHYRAQDDGWADA
jgi:hypothetical protein